MSLSTLHRALACGPLTRGAALLPHRPLARGTSHVKHRCSHPAPSLASSVRYVTTCAHRQAHGPHQHKAASPPRRSYSARHAICDQVDGTHMPSGGGEVSSTEAAPTRAGRREALRASMFEIEVTPGCAQWRADRFILFHLPHVGYGLCRQILQKRNVWCGMRRIGYIYIRIYIYI